MKTVISVRTDKVTKRDAQAFAGRIGVPLSSLINAYLRDIVATGRVEFSAYEPMTAQLERTILAVRKEMEEKGTVGPFRTGKAAIAFLHRNAS